MDKVLMPKRLTAENGAKKLLIGEFKEKVIFHCENCDGEGSFEYGGTCLECGGSGEYSVSVPISWDNIKSIYRKIVEHFTMEE